MSLRPYISIGLLAAAAAAAQAQAPDTTLAPVAVKDEAPVASAFIVNTGTTVPLSLINSISTKHSAEGDRVYLETAFPILANGRIVIPVGSYVAGTVTQIKRPGRVKGRAELYVRFDSLTLPNGVTRNFHGRLGNMDASSEGEVDRTEGKVTGERNRSGDARTIAEGAAAGTSIGAIAGSVGGHTAMGLGVGAAAGAAAGLIGVLVTRGPDAILAKGSTIEMVLDRSISFSETELNFGNYQAPRMAAAEQAPGSPKAQPLVPLRRFPY